MGLKSHYREKPQNIPAETPKPAIEIKSDGMPVDTATATLEVPRSEAELDQAFKQQAESDPTLALKREIEALRHSEAMQHQRRAAAPTPQPLPANREARIALWKEKGGLSDQDAAFLRARPTMVDHPEITRAAYAAILHAGIARDSKDFPTAMEGAFNTMLGRTQPQAPPEPPPAFFEPPAPEASMPSAASMYAAPVSRGEPGGDYSKPITRITLTREQKEAARISGISESEYARQELRRLEEVRSGMRQP